MRMSRVGTAAFAAATILADFRVAFLPRADFASPVGFDLRATLACERVLRTAPRFRA